MKAEDVKLSLECRLSERHKSLDQMTHVAAELWRVQPRSLEYEIRNIARNTQRCSATPALVQKEWLVCT